MFDNLTGRAIGEDGCVDDSVHFVPLNVLILKSRNANEFGSRYGQFVLNYMNFAVPYKITLSHGSMGYNGRRVNYVSFAYDGCSFHKEYRW